MKNFWLKFRNWLLLFGDIIILYLALWITLIIRYQDRYSEMIGSHIIPFSIIFLIWVITFYIGNLYDLRKAKNKSQFFLSLLLILTICGFIGMGFFYLLPNIGISPKTNLALDLLITTIFIFIWRIIFNKLVSAPNKKIIFIGDNEQVQNIIKEIKNNPQWGYEVETIIPADNFSDFDNFLQKKDIATLVISDDLYQTQKLTDKLYASLSKNIEIFTLTHFYEQLLKKIPLAVISKIWFLENLALSNKFTFDKIKRLMDIILSIIGLIITLPFYPLIYLLIKIDSRGSLFYTQNRMGILGEKFTIIKFRSMVKDAEKNGAEWAQTNDPRITSVGKFIRKTRLDELPQLFNVLWGEMSFIGPRPERPEFIEQLEQEIPFYKQRLLVKPGLSGWAQVNYKYSSDVEGALEKLQFDLFYVKNRSLFIDLTIILKTINIVLRGGGH